MNNDDSILIKNARLAVDIELQTKKAMKLPISKYNPKTGEVFLEHSDGTCELVGKRITQGRFSER